MNPVPILIVVPAGLRIPIEPPEHTASTPIRTSLRCGLLALAFPARRSGSSSGLYTLVAEVGLVLRDALVACQLNRDLRLS